MANISTLATDRDMGETFNVCDLYTETDTDILDIITACFNLVFSIPAIPGNLLILLAIRRTSSMGLPSKVLFGSLAFSDFCVGSIVHPSFALHKLFKHELARCIVGLVYDFSSGHLSLDSLLTMVFISLDKFMALHLKLRYRAVVTYKRSIVLVAVIWTISVPWSASYLLHPHLYFLMVLLAIPMSFFVTSIVFAKIYTTLRRQQDRLSVSSQESSVPRPSSAVSISRYRNSVTNMLYVYSALLVAYLPIWIVLLIRIIYEQTTMMLKHATEIALLLLLFNSTVNPGLYLWRIRHIRLASFDLLRRMLFWRRATIENNCSRNSARSEVFSLERIQRIEVGLENYATTNDLPVNGLGNNCHVFTTHF